jgi:putative PIN family toxin of toxin-antitoxin system
LCVRNVLARQLPLVFSTATYDELADVLMRAKLDRYVSRRTREALLRTWRKAAVMFPEAALREEVRDCRDPDDDKFLELALASGARALVTGDADLLVLDPWRGVRIVKLTDFEKVVLPLIDAE